MKISGIGRKTGGSDTTASSPPERGNEIWHGSEAHPSSCSQLAAGHAQLWSTIPAAQSDGSIICTLRTPMKSSIARKRDITDVDRLKAEYA